jgi:hypothetical protein
MCCMLHGYVRDIFKSVMEILNSLFKQKLVRIKTRGMNIQ